MAALKVAQLRASLEEFALLYEHAGATADASALRLLAEAMKRADKHSVDELLIALEESIGSTSTGSG